MEHVPSKDLDDRGQVLRLVELFYADVARDDLLGPIFNDAAQVSWPEHIEKITNFWCRELFGTPGYSGNPFKVHRSIHEKEPFTNAHFDRWLALFARTVDERWVGPNAEHVKAKAAKVAQIHSYQLTRPSGKVQNVSDHAGSEE